MQSQKTHYNRPVGCDRIPTIVFLVAFISQVSGAMTSERRDFAANGGGGDGGAPSTLFNNVRDTFASWTEQTANASQSALWAAGKFLLSMSEWANSAWNVMLNAAMNVLKAGGAVFGAVAARIGRVPVLGFGANGVNVAIETALKVADSNAKHDVEAREKAFAALNGRMNESGKRLSDRTAVRPAHDGAVRFPRN